MENSFKISAKELNYLANYLEIKSDDCDDSVQNLDFSAEKTVESYQKKVEKSLKFLNKYRTDLIKINDIMMFWLYKIFLTALNFYWKRLSLLDSTISFNENELSNFTSDTTQKFTRMPEILEAKIPQNSVDTTSALITSQSSSNNKSLSIKNIVFSFVGIKTNEEPPKIMAEKQFKRSFNYKGFEVINCGIDMKLELDDKIMEEGEREDGEEGEIKNESASVTLPQSLQDKIYSNISLIIILLQTFSSAKSNDFLVSKFTKYPLFQKEKLWEKA